MVIAMVRQTPNGIQTAYATALESHGLTQPRRSMPIPCFNWPRYQSRLATVVAHQVGLGGIRWDTPVQHELPWFSLFDAAISAQLTIGDLYAHRSGLPGQAGDLLEYVGFSQIYILEHLDLLKLDPAPFRTKYAYSNFGLTTGALAVSAAVDPTNVTSLSDQWADLSKRVLYQPFGMDVTSSGFIDFDTRSNRAFGHVPVSPGSTNWKRCEVRQPDAQSPAGGVSSSVNDMARWLAMLIGKGAFGGQPVVADAALASALTPQIQKPAPPGLPASYYGYGFGVSSTTSGRASYSHSGAFVLGVSTSFMVIPSLGIGIVVLTNGYPQGVPETLIAQFFDLVEYGKF